MKMHSTSTTFADLRKELQESLREEMGGLKQQTIMFFKAIENKRRALAKEALPLLLPVPIEERKYPFLRDTLMIQRVPEGKPLDHSMEVRFYYDCEYAKVFSVIVWTKNKEIFQTIEFKTLKGAEYHLAEATEEETY